MRRNLLEKILMIFGAIVSLLTIVTGFGLKFLHGREEYMDVLYNKLDDNAFEDLSETMMNAGMDWILPGLIGLAFGVVGMICLFKNMYVTYIGWFSVGVAGLVSVISTFGAFMSVFFIIAGLVILVRRSVRAIE